MKKIIMIFLAAFVLLTLQSSAQTTKMTDSAAVFSIADSATFTGKYKYENLPFEYMTVGVQDGKLYYSGGEYSGLLTPVKDKKDVFDANANAAVFTFVRDADNKVTDLQIDYQGESYVGKREQEAK